MVFIDNKILFLNYGGMGIFLLMVIYFFVIVLLVVEYIDMRFCVVRIIMFFVCRYFGINFFRVRI